MLLLLGFDAGLANDLAPFIDLRLQKLRVFGGRVAGERNGAFLRQTFLELGALERASDRLVKGGEHRLWYRGAREDSVPDGVLESGDARFRDRRHVRQKRRARRRRD